jgi:hypothetical protein
MIVSFSRGAWKTRQGVHAARIGGFAGFDIIGTIALALLFGRKSIKEFRVLVD